MEVTNALGFSFTAAYVKLAGPQGSGASLVFVSHFITGLQTKVTMSGSLRVLEIRTQVTTLAQQAFYAWVMSPAQEIDFKKSRLRLKR